MCVFYISKITTSVQLLSYTYFSFITIEHEGWGKSVPPYTLYIKKDKEGRQVVRGPEVSRRQEMRHDGLTKEPADIINADQSAATFVRANIARSGDQLGLVYV